MTWTTSGHDMTALYSAVCCKCKERTWRHLETAQTRQRPYQRSTYLPRPNQTIWNRRNTWNQLEYTIRAHPDLAAHSLGRFWKTQLSHPQAAAHTRQRPAYTPTIKPTN